MKVRELYDHVAQLGFEDNMQEYDKHFVLTANRALFQVSALRPETRSIIIHHEPLDNMISNATGLFTPQKKVQDVIFMADGAKSYYFEAIGNGTCAIEWFVPDTESEDDVPSDNHPPRYIGPDDTGTWYPCASPISISTKTYQAFRGFFKHDGAFINGRVRLRFTGDYVFFFKNVALYQYILGDAIADIPAFLPTTSYDVSDMTTDFLRFCDSPIVDDASHECLNTSEYDIENETCICLPYDKPGSYKVEYYRKPNLIVDDGDSAHCDDKIDLAEDLCEILPLLIASFVWADDEPAKSEYYYTIYNAQAAIVVANARRVKPAQYRSTYGW